MDKIGATHDSGQGVDAELIFKTVTEDICQFNKDNTNLKNVPLQQKTIPLNIAFTSLVVTGLTNKATITLRKSAPGKTLQESFAWHPWRITLDLDNCRAYRGGYGC